MRLHPLRLSTSVKAHVFGGRAIPDRLGRGGLPAGRIAETWEVSDVDGEVGVVQDGPLTGRTLRSLVEEYGADLVGQGWSGGHFPVLTKFIDATGVLPVHLHADDETARRLEGEPNGKTEAWHVLDAAPGATALCGVRAGVTADELHRALLEQDFYRVLRRLPVRAGETIYVPGGTLHSFGPDTLVYEIEQTSDVQQHAMRWNMEDGSPVPDDEWHANLEALMAQVRLDVRPDFRPGLAVAVDDGVERVVLCAGEYFALERWRVSASTRTRLRFDRARVLSNVGAPVSWRSGEEPGRLGRAETLLLPAALGEIEIDGPADVLVGWLPELERDVHAPLRSAGYGDAALATLGPASGPIVST